MTKVLVTQSKLDTLAEIVGGKSNTNVPLTLDEMITAADSITSGGGITPTGNIDITSSGVTDVTNYATATVPSATYALGVETNYYTENGVRKWRRRPYITIDSSEGDTEGWIGDGTDYGNYASINAIAKNTTVTPTESSQTIGGTNYMMEGAVTVNAIPSNYVGSGITSRSSTDLTASNLTVTAPSGYYSSSASKTLTDANLVAGNIKKDVSIFGVTGSYEGSSSGMVIATASTTLNAASTSISFTGLSGDPTSFVICSSADLTTGGTKAAAVVFDGTNVIGQTITSQVTYDGTNFSKSYNGGTLTVSGTASFQANTYTLVYTYGGTSANLGTADVQVGSGATSITFTGLTEEPDYFSCIFKSDFSTSSGYQRVIAVVYDGSSTYGLAMDSGAKAQTSWSYTYNNGTLVLSSTGTNNGGYFHQPGYYQLTYGIGGEPTPITTESLSVTSNGTYTAPAGKAYTPVVVNVSGGGASSVETTTKSNSDNTATSLQFTGLKGTPIAWFVRCATQMQSSSTTYYYVSNMRYNGTNVNGNAFRMGSTRQVTVVTSGYSYTYNNGTLTLTSSGSRTSAPGSFYNGTYELTYIY